MHITVRMWRSLFTTNVQHIQKKRQNYRQLVIHNSDDTVNYVNLTHILFGAISSNQFLGKRCTCIEKCGCCHNMLSVVSHLLSIVCNARVLRQNSEDRITWFSLKSNSMPLILARQCSWPNSGQVSLAEPQTKKSIGRSFVTKNGSPRHVLF